MHPNATCTNGSLKNREKIYLKKKNLNKSITELQKKKKKKEEEEEEEKMFVVHSNVILASACFKPFQGLPRRILSCACHYRSWHCLIACGIIHILCYGC